MAKVSLGLFEPPRAVKTAISEALAEFLATYQKQKLSAHMSAENMLHYRHSPNWTHPANEFDPDGEMTAHHAEFSFPFQRLVDGDLSLITESLSSIASQLEKEMLTLFYQTANDACEKSGNVVQNNDPAQGFLDALERVEFSVNAKGEVELPQFHVGDANFIEILKAQPPEFGERMEEIKSRKSAEALIREQARRQKFKGHTS